MTLDIRQSNHEGHLIDWLHEAQASASANAVILNPGGYSHTSVALHDAVKAIATPVIEVHLSDPETREAFRHTDLVALAATQADQGLRGARIFAGTGRGGPALTGSAADGKQRGIQNGRSKGTADGQCASTARWCRELAELLSANELTEIEVEDGDRKIRCAAMPRR